MTTKRFNGLKHLSVVLAGAGLVALSPADANAMDPFVESTDLLNNTAVASGAPIAIADMNADGLDDVVRLDGTRFLQIEYQQEDGSFELFEAGDTNVLSWSIAVADVDGNGYNDIFAGGAFDEKVVYMANDDGTEYVRTTLGGPGIFVQCSSFADINNDGGLDFFVCHDVGKSLVFENDGAGGLAPTYQTLDPVSTVPSDNSGNYGNVWSDYDKDGDFDLYISKCRQGNNNPNSGERLNLLFQNDGSGGYEDVAGDVGLLPRGQTWASDFADIDNDGDLDAFILNHTYNDTDAPSGLYTNTDNEFTEITASAGMVDALEDVGLGIQTYFGDFDNDGYVDLFVSSGQGDHQMFFNNGDQTFTLDNSVFDVGNRTIQSFAVGDLNNDGFLDLVAGFGTFFNNPSGGNDDALLMNPANNGNGWLKVHLRGVDSNLSAVGARIEINGAWGQQTREIRAGESYGVSHSLTEHFGVGDAKSIDSVVITWPSGQVDTIDDVGINQTIDVTEGCPTEFYADADGDGFGDPSTGEASCIAPEGRVADNTDCDDDDANNFPGNEEVCDGADNNCNDESDEGLDATCNAGTSSGGDDESESASDGDDAGTTTGDPTGPDSTTGPADPTDDTATGGESSGGSGGASGDGGGCAVSTPSSDAFWLLMLLGFAAPVARRRQTR